MRLEMNSQRAQIGMKTTPPVQDIQQPHAELDLKTTHAKAQVEGTLPKVQIDQSQAFSESGLKGIVDFTSEIIQRAKSDMQNAMARAADQGNQLADIHNSTNVIAENADDNAWGQFENEFGMVTMPSSRPEITVIEGELDIQVQEGKVENNTRAQKPIVDYRRGKLDIYLKQRNSLEIRAVEDQFDLKV